MRITIITVGKQREQYFKNKIVDYSKSIQKKIKLVEYEVSDEGTECIGNKILEEKIRDIEGTKILEKVSNYDFVISLDIFGEKMNTNSIKSYIYEIKDFYEDIVFIIGGSIGLSKKVLKRSNLKISFGKMTYPHQIMKVLLLEQIDKILK